MGYNQPEINSSRLEWWKFHNEDLCYISILAKKYVPQCMCNQLRFRAGVH